MKMLDQLEEVTTRLMGDQARVSDSTDEARLLSEQARAISATDLERARNQLRVSLVRTAERPLRMLQRCVDQLWAGGGLFTVDAAIASLDALGAEAVRQSFEDMLAHPPATVLVGAGGTARGAREVQGQLQPGRKST